MLNTTNAEYSSIEVWFTDQSSEPLEIEDNVNMTLIIAKLLGYSKNYKKPTGSLWNYYRDEPNDFPANNYNANPIQILNLLNTKQVLQEKHQMQIKKMVKTLSKKIQRLKKILKLLFH